MEQKPVKQEGMQQRNSAGNSERALPHQPMHSLNFILTVQDMSADILVSFAICALTDPILNHWLIRWSSSITMDKDDDMISATVDN